LDWIEQAQNRIPVVISNEEVINVWISQKTGKFHDEVKDCLFLNNGFGQDKGKGEIHRRTGREGPEGEQRYGCTFSSPSAVDGVGNQLHAPAALHPGNIRYPYCRRLGGP
jgi:hypothetical protein